MRPTENSSSPFEEVSGYEKESGVSTLIHVERFWFVGWAGSLVRIRAQASGACGRGFKSLPARQSYRVRSVLRDVGGGV